MIVFNRFRSAALAVHRFIERLPVYVFIPFMTIASIVLIIPLIIPVVYWLGESTSPFEDNSFWFSVIVGLIVAPLFETAVFQLLIIQFLRSFTGFSAAWLVIISAALFGVAHSYDLGYIIFAFFVGLVLAYAYVIYLHKPQSAYWVVTGIHALRNGLALFVQFVL